MPWFKPATRPFQTALAMIGARAGHRVLIAGAADGRLAAAVSHVTGLNGQTLVFDPSPNAQRTTEAAAADEGVLVDFEQGPLDQLPSTPHGFDVVVIQRSLTGSTAPAAVIAEAARVVREGGRVVVIEGGTTSAMFGLIRRHTPGMNGEAVSALLSSAGLRAVRVLAEVEGTAYIEGFKR